MIDRNAYFSGLRASNSNQPDCIVACYGHFDLESPICNHCQHNVFCASKTRSDLCAKINRLNKYIKKVGI